MQSLLVDAVRAVLHCKPTIAIDLGEDILYQCRFKRPKQAADSTARHIGAQLLVCIALERSCCSWVSED